jgi:hypothetical protein
MCCNPLQAIFSLYFKGWRWNPTDNPQDAQCGNAVYSSHHYPSCYPGCLPSRTMSWLIHSTHSERHTNQRWADGPKAYLRGRLQRTPSLGFTILPLSAEAWYGFLTVFFEQGSGEQRYTHLAPPFNFPCSQRSCQSSLKYCYRDIKPFLLGCFIFHIQKLSKVAPKSSHRTAGDIPLAKKDTVLSCILYW